MILLSLLHAVRLSMRRRATLSILNGLDDRTLHDIGLSRGQLPPNWGAE